MQRFKYGFPPSADTTGRGKFGRYSDPPVGTRRVPGDGTRGIRGYQGRWRMCSGADEAGRENGERGFSGRARWSPNLPGLRKRPMRGV